MIRDEATLIETLRVIKDLTDTAKLFTNEAAIHDLASDALGEGTPNLDKSKIYLDKFEKDN